MMLKPLVDVKLAMAAHSSAHESAQMFIQHVIDEIRAINLDEPDGRRDLVTLVDGLDVEKYTLASAIVHNTEIDPHPAP